MTISVTRRIDYLEFCNTEKLPKSIKNCQRRFKNVPNKKITQKITKDVQDFLLVS